ncbi:MAG: hypothetical protein HRU02_17395 [Myxococcales bacterium]|nr:hypothetical protein [Myxococcales bacterium]
MSDSKREAFLRGLLAAAIAVGFSLAPRPGTSEESDDLDYPIFLTSMTHMEGNASDNDSLAAFLANVHLLEAAMTLAEANGAILTIETEQPFARANVTWKRNFLQEILNRNHGVGTHCDVGYGDPSMSQRDYERELRVNKTLVDDLVGATHNTGCSGAGGDVDWVRGLANAGFEYVDGVVGMHYMPTRPWSRPAGYTNEAIRFDGLYHAQVPVDLLDRTYLRTLADVRDLEHDAVGGQLVLSSGGLGKLQGIAEGGYVSQAFFASSSSPAGSSKLVLDVDDVDALVELIYWIDENRDRSRISKISIMSHATDWRDENETEMTYFLEEMEALQEDQVIRWATEKEVVDIYLALP